MTIDFNKILDTVNNLKTIARDEDDEYGETIFALATLLWRRDYISAPEEFVTMLLNIADEIIKTHEEEAINDIDPRTGLEWGDHGTSQEAMRWCLHIDDDTDPYNIVEFLKSWEEGDLTEWPEYYTWLKDRRK